MNKKTAIAIATVAALSGTCQSAQADEILDFILGHHPKVDRRVEAAGLGVGIATSVGYLAAVDFRFDTKLSSSTRISGLNAGAVTVATTVGCAVLSPMVATAVVDRPLTYREADTLIAGCFVPFLGPYLVNYWFDTHPELDPDLKNAAPTRKRKKIARR